MTQPNTFIPLQSVHQQDNACENAARLTSAAQNFGAFYRVSSMQFIYFYVLPVQVQND